MGIPNARIENVIPVVRLREPDITTSSQVVYAGTPIGLLLVLTQAIRLDLAITRPQGPFIRIKNT